MTDKGAIGLDEEYVSRSSNPNSLGEISGPVSQLWSNELGFDVFLVLIRLDDLHPLAYLCLKSLSFPGQFAHVGEHALDKLVEHRFILLQASRALSPT